MGRTALLEAFAQSDLDMNGFRILNALSFGTVTSVGISMPSQFTVTNSPVVDQGVIGINWAAGQPVPIGNLPVAKGVGTAHAAGIVPDPGASGGATDYLSRDMTWRTISGAGGVPAYQPVVPTPTLAVTAGPPPPYTVQVTDSLSGASLFYSINNPGGGFAAVPGGGNVTGVGSGMFVYAYGASAGYSNSAIGQIQMAAPLATELVTGDDGANITGDDSATVRVGPT